MYTYKDRELTKEQVDKLAAEKGVEVDVFLTNNPDIQIQEAVVETTEPEGKTTTTEIGHVCGCNRSVRSYGITIGRWFFGIRRN